MIDSFFQVMLWTSPLYIIYYFYSKSKREDAELTARLVTLLYETSHNVSIETHSGMEYWFDSDTKKFIAAVLKSRWSQHIFIINQTEIVMGPLFNSIFTSWEKAAVCKNKDL